MNLIRKMIIRQATIDDSKFIASCLFLAMEDIVYNFIGERNSHKALQLFQHFAETDNNQYSYQNCWVAEIDGEIVAAVNIYNGENLIELRKPVIQYIKTLYNKDFNPEDETQSGEYYIDTFAVKQSKQGKGIGTKMLQFLIEKYVIQNHQTLGLLVEEDNLPAKKLYYKLGFKPMGKKTLVGKNMEHLQINNR